MEGAIERAHSIAKSHSLALSRLRLHYKQCKFTADLNFKSLITCYFKTAHSVIIDLFCIRGFL